MPPKKSKSAKASAAASGAATPSGTPVPPTSATERFSIADHPRPFKNPNYRNAGAKRKTKAVKIMLLAERDREVAEVTRMKKEREAKMDVDGETGKGKEEGVLICYSSLEAPPSLIPAKRYCDITGLEAPYTDPQTGLRYHDKSIFAHVRTLKPATVQAFLSLRGGGQAVIV